MRVSWYLSESNETVFRLAPESPLDFACLEQVKKMQVTGCRPVKEPNSTDGWPSPTGAILLVFGEHKTNP